MRTENDKLGEIHRDNGLWRFHAPIFDLSNKCCVCGELIDNDMIEYSISCETGIDYYQYHKPCIELALQNLLKNATS